MTNQYRNGIKILAIGNSFSCDALYYMPDMLCQLGMDADKITLVNTFIGGCDLYTHAQNARNNNAAYIRQSFHRDGEVRSSDSLYTLKALIQEQPWDVITLQQASGSSGKAETYNADLDYMIKWVKANALNPAFRFGWHMTWAYRENPPTVHPNFADYGFSQQVMYDRICGAVKSKILPCGTFDFIIPAGAAIQNARRYFGDTLNVEDGYHLANFGRYIAAAMWVKTIIGLDIAGLKVPYGAAADGPDVVIDREVLAKIVQSANAAAGSPFIAVQAP